VLRLTTYLLLCIGASLHVSAASISLDTCHALAERNYPLVRQYELLEKTKEFTLSNASKAYLPQFSITGIGGVIFGGLPGSTQEARGTLIGIGQLNQTIWDGGAVSTQKDIIGAQTEVEKASIAVSMHELHSRVNQVFFGVLLIDEQMAQLSQRTSMLKNNIDRVRQMYENGLAYSTDVDEMNAELLIINQRRTELTYSRRAYLRVLSVMTGVYLPDDTQLTKPVTVDASMSARISRPELSLFEQQRNLINAQAQMHNVSLMPKFGLMGAGVVLYPGMGIGPFSEDVTALAVIGLSASWSIGGFYRSSNEDQLHELSLERIKVQEDVFLRNTQTQLTQVNANIEKQRAVLAEDEKIVDLRRKIREGYQVKYENGVCSVHDLLQASERENESRSEKALREMQLLMTMYEFQTIHGN